MCNNSHLNLRHKQLIKSHNPSGMDAGRYTHTHTHTILMCLWSESLLESGENQEPDHCVIVSGRFMFCSNRLHTWMSATLAECNEVNELNFYWLYVKLCCASVHITGFLCESSVDIVFQNCPLSALGMVMISNWQKCIIQKSKAVNALIWCCVCAGPSFSLFLCLCVCMCVSKHVCVCVCVTSPL